MSFYEIKRSDIFVFFRFYLNPYFNVTKINSDGSVLREVITAATGLIITRCFAVYSEFSPERNELHCINSSSIAAAKCSLQKHSAQWTASIKPATVSLSSRRPPQRRPLASGPLCPPLPAAERASPGIAREGRGWRG